MVPAGIEAVVFDAVGTLLYPEPAAAQVYAEVGRRLGTRHTAEEIALRFADAFGREDDVDARSGLQTSEARELRRWANIVARVLDDVSDPVRCFHTLYQHFAAPSAWRCNPDAEAIIQELSARGLRLGMASNYDQRLRSVARRRAAAVCRGPDSDLPRAHASAQRSGAGPGPPPRRHSRAKPSRRLRGRRSC